MGGSESGLGRASNMLDFLRLAIPLGLAMDLFGVLLVIRYGHSLFIRIGETTPEPGQGKDGDLFFTVRGGDSGQNKRHRRLANAGVMVVVAGFAMQLVGSTVSLYCGS